MSNKNLFFNKKAYATSLMTVLMDVYGTEFLEWEPETLSMELENLLGSSPNAYIMDRIHAGSSLLTTNLFHISIEGFCNVCNVLNFGKAYTDSFIPCDLDDIIWGVTEARLIQGGEEFDKEEFSHDICLFTGKRLQEEGITNPPSILNWAEYPNNKEDLNLILANDPFISEVYEKRQKEASEDLTQYAKVKLIELLNQVKDLSLNNKDVDINIEQTINNIKGI